MTGLEVTPRSAALVEDDAGHAAVGKVGPLSVATARGLDAPSDERAERPTAPVGIRGMGEEEKRCLLPPHEPGQPSLRSEGQLRAATEIGDHEAKSP